MSAQKAILGFKTETRELLEGTKENNVLPDGDESVIFYLKQTEKN